MDFLYHIHIMTLFPDVVGDMLCESILGRAQERDIIRIDCHQIRDYTLNKQKQVDDYPYGGGHGAVMQADPLYQCWQHLCDLEGERAHTIYLSPAGTVFRQADAKRLHQDHNKLILVCGHYEGIDQRFIDECVDEEISLGDFVLTGGEIPAMAVADAVCRLVPGSCQTRSASPMRATGMVCWNTPSTPGRRCGTTGESPPSSSLAITPTSPNGGGSKPSSAPETGGRICTNGWPPLLQSRPKAAERDCR